MSNSANRRLRPNTRHRFRFYIPSSETVASGELRQQYTLKTAGYFAMEKPMRPGEIVEGARIVPEQSFLLIGQWTKSLAAVTAGYLAFNPATNKTYAVDGNAFDPWGDRKKIHIYVVDNATSDIDETDFRNE